MLLQAVRDWARELREQCSRSSARAVANNSSYPAPPPLPPIALTPLSLPVSPPRFLLQLPLTPASCSDVVLALSLNKTDLPADRQLVTRAQAQQAAAAIGCSM